MIKFNPAVKLILADVDETVADVYTPATPAMIDELNLLFPAGYNIQFWSGKHRLHEGLLEYLQSRHG